MDNTEYVFLTLTDIQRQLDRTFIPALRNAAGTNKEVACARRVGEACMASIPKVARGGWDSWISDRTLSKDESHLFMRMASGMSMDQANAHGSLTACATALHIVMPDTLVAEATTAEPDALQQAQTTIAELRKDKEDTDVMVPTLIAETVDLADQLAKAKDTIDELRKDKAKLRRSLNAKSKQFDQLKAELG